MQNTDNKTYGLMGKNISYSLSPVMHNAAFKHFNIPQKYEIFDIEENEVYDFFQNRIWKSREAGVNVTVPYKIKMKNILEEHNADMDSLVNILGSLNTIRSDGRQLYGYNTDVKGFYESLVEDTGADTKGKKIFIFGAGGAGRAICIYLALKADPAGISVYDIDRRKVDSLKDMIGSSRVGSLIDFVESPNDISWSMKGCDLVINATTLGTKENDPAPFDLDLLRESMAVYDLVYARETELVKYAKENGLTASGGLGMLVNQAALAFEIWTEKPFVEVKKVMREAAEEDLGRRKKG
ncbi:MAG: shikimate dehydrogenase [Candidatus Omnitrophica bacterium]|nr:shikimate dehydrogenase [Candidatus Omnitrophota bacterium]